ncbi:MAG: hypothetical protein Q4Q23_05045 [Methanobacteriaceae archaeon]|nr:hypothetical protein [Methanobacteriaceae archaeon]
MEIETKMAFDHVIGGVIAGIISHMFTSGVLPIRNQVLGVLISLVLLYGLGQFSEKRFGKEEIGGFKSWFSNGIILFYFVWMMIWIFLSNVPIF